MKSAYLYVRVSTDEQRRKGYLDFPHDHRSNLTYPQQEG